MLLVLGFILVFILSFFIIAAMYFLLVANKLVKKKRIEKIFRLALVYSLFIALVYAFQYLFI